MKQVGVDNEKGAHLQPSPTSFSLPFPPSMNGLYGVNYKMRCVYLTNDARYWKSKAKLFIPAFKCSETHKIKISLKMLNNWFFKNGKQKRVDVQNLIKVVVDAISEKCGFNDCQVWTFSAQKIQSTTEQSVFVQMEIQDETHNLEETKPLEKSESRQT